MTGTAVVFGLLKSKILFGLRLIIYLLKSAGFKPVGYQVLFECLIKECDTINLKRKKNTFVSPSQTHEHMTHPDTLYVFFKVTEAQYAAVFLLGVSFQECKCLGPRHSVIYLLIYLSTHLPVPLCLPVAHSSSLSACVSPVGPRTPPLAPLCPVT